MLRPTSSLSKCFFSSYKQRQKEETVRVRFAPSPTGNLHLGGLRTALYNYLFAKKHKGAFILRVEDTDQTRLVPEAISSIYSSLRTHGLNPDEGPEEGGDFGPYVQSERLRNYKDAAETLLESKKAYRCFCSAERLLLLRKEATRKNELPKYDRRCLGMEPSKAKAMATDGVPHVIRFQLDQQAKSFEDEVFGEQTQTLDESDLVLLKSDGFPTYHLANIVDDHAMHISHVIRGAEWLSSTAKHKILYDAFNWKTPKFIHLPLIMKNARQKLSKRDKDGYANWYTDVLGVLPIATLNLLIRNGSGIKDFDEHLYSLEEMVGSFDATLITRRNLLLDSHFMDKYSRESFRKADFDKVLYPKIVSRLRKGQANVNPELLSKAYIRKVVDFLMKNEEEFGYLNELSVGKFQWFFQEPSSSKQILQNYDKEELLSVLTDLQTQDSWDSEGLKLLASKNNMALNRFLGLIRLAVIDSKQGPPISELVAFFGVKECARRMRLMLGFVKNS